MWHALLVAFGASLWATDTLFRHPLTQQISPFTIVYFEHIFATLFSFIFLILTRDREKIWLGPKEFASSAFIGVFGSAIATVLFTSSFQFVNPSITILLQKTQPIFVIFLSAIFLKEKLTPVFLIWAALALTGAFFISFPHGLGEIDFHSSDSIGSALAIFAALFWAVSTVVGRSALQKTPSSVLSFWRFAFGLFALYLCSKRIDLMKIEIPFVPGNPEVLRSLFLMALIPGFAGVSIYYRGLSKIRASTATLLELSFPLTAVAVNAYFLNLHLTRVQLAASALLLIAMVGALKSTQSK